MKNKDIEIQERAVLCRQNIFTAGKQLFMTKGYFQTNTKEIAKAAGISIGSFYNYYEDKLDLFKDILTMEIKNNYITLRDTLASLPQSREGIKDTLFHYIKEGFEISVCNRTLYSDLQNLAVSHPEIMTDINQITADIPGILYNYVTSTPDIVKRASPDIMSMMLYAIVQGVSEYIVVPPDEEEANKYYRQLTNILYWYMYGEDDN